MTITHASDLTDTDLVAAVGRLAGAEREATVALIVHLAEFDARRLFEGLGFSSTFRYCRDILHLSEDAAFNRIEAARAARRYPAALDMLMDGRLSPTTLRMLSRHLTPGNHCGLLAAAAGKSKPEVDVLIASVSPRPDVPSTIRRLPRAVSAEIAVVADERAAALSMPRPAQALAIEQRPPTRPPVVRPLAPERFEVRFTVGADTRERLREAQDLLGHAVPGGDLGAIFDRALTALVTELKRRKFAAAKPRPAKAEPAVRSTAAPSMAKAVPMPARTATRHIPAAVRRAVATRDGERCAFVAPNGRRCDARRFLEYHHVHPYATGGPPTVANMELRCGVHNRLEARLYYGPMRHDAGLVRAPALGTEGPMG